MRTKIKNKFNPQKTNLVVIEPKEENYLLNEIIEHILKTRHQTRVEWEKIKNIQFRGRKTLSRGFTPSRYQMPTFEFARNKFHKSQST